jgi:hypothetical protein
MESSFCDRCENIMKVGSLGSVLIRTCTACGFQKRGETEFVYSIKRTHRGITIATAHPLHYLDPCLPVVTTACPHCEETRDAVVYVANTDGARGLTCTTCGTRWLA